MQQIKGSNVVARCKAGEESEDKDTETGMYFTDNLTCSNI